MTGWARRGRLRWRTSPRSAHRVHRLGAPGDLGPRLPHRADVVRPLQGGRLQHRLRLRHHPVDALEHHPPDIGHRQLLDADHAQPGRLRLQQPVLERAPIPGQALEAAEILLLHDEHLHARPPGDRGLHRELRRLDGVAGRRHRHHHPHRVATFGKDRARLVVQDAADFGEDVGAEVHHQPAGAQRVEQVVPGGGVRVVGDGAAGVEGLRVARVVMRHAVDAVLLAEDRRQPRLPVVFTHLHRAHQQRIAVEQAHQHGVCGRGLAAGLVVGQQQGLAGADGSGRLGGGPAK